MLKVTRRSRLAVTAATTTLAVALTAGLAFAGLAFADHGSGSDSPVTLNGDWAPFNRCPVDSPTMLAADGETSAALCFADNSPSGSLKIGNLTVATKDSNHQFGIISKEGLTVVESASPGLEDEPVEVPGGLQGLICPSEERFVRHICRKYHHGWWDDRANEVTLTIEQAGPLSNFNLFAGAGQPVGSQPVKIHLQNWLLGDDCYLGSDAEPIVLQPMNLSLPVGGFDHFESNGTPLPAGSTSRMGRFAFLNTQGAGFFAVPAASGCGFRGVFDQAIDGKVGLPSPAANNDVVFNEASTYLGGISNPGEVAPNAGKELSKYWHSAVVSTEEGSEEEGSEHHDHPGSSGHLSAHEFEAGFRHWFSHGH
jgi:hypothetical protein